MSPSDRVYEQPVFVNDIPTFQARRSDVPYTLFDKGSVGAQLAKACAPRKSQQDESDTHIQSVDAGRKDLVLASQRKRS